MEGKKKNKLKKKKTPYGIKTCLSRGKCMSNRKYWFAYHNYHGMIYPFAWVEDDGIAVGGRPLFLVGQKAWEITADQFNGALTDLERRYPVEVPTDDTG